MRIGKKLAGMLLRDNVISSEEVEVVEYGLENFGSSLLGMSITLLIGYCFGFLRGSFLLWLLIFPLRKNAGGYHAETKSRCLLYSSAILFVSVICFVQVEWLDLGYILVAGFFFAIIFLLAPVENDNKRLELVEYRVYRKRARIILLLEGTLFATAVTFKWEELIAVITIVFFIVGMSLIIGKVKLWCTIYKKVER
ncbi:accessory gene regulator ArgB-like protein [uncultured Acetatifactor sp.]|uniref:accessory gene regulator ArgB-like protein n=1 Tax=uncultured Acetatifactor sp. TaxID=1671927 RepID=UPI00260916E0|nr:accessory gene regulator B family protein [uncultured Acetatifactor sp.]